MKLRISLLAIALVLAGAASSRAADRPDLSGKWVLSKARSVFGVKEFASLDRAVVRIEHREPEFSFRRVFIRQGESHVLEYRLSSDGKDVADAKEGSVSRLSWDGDVLVYLTTYTTPRGTATNTVRYRLLDGGKTLEARESFRGPRVSYDNTWVFERE